jgi:hypothetical protein
MHPCQGMQLSKRGLPGGSADCSGFLLPQELRRPGGQPCASRHLRPPIASFDSTFAPPAHPKANARWAIPALIEGIIPVPLGCAESLGSIRRPSKRWVQADWPLTVRLRLPEPPAREERHRAGCDSHDEAVSRRQPLLQLLVQVLHLRRRKRAFRAFRYQQLHDERVIRTRGGSER